jgi:hypothetical protein
MWFVFARFGFRTGERNAENTRAKCRKVSFIFKLYKCMLTDCHVWHGWTIYVKRYSSPVTGLEWPRGFQEVKR